MMRGMAVRFGLIIAEEEIKQAKLGSDIYNVVITVLQYLPTQPSP